jgi:flagellum-specific peptidoglycan hydrolase FlgJ
MGYQYSLHQHKKKLLAEKSELRKNQESYSTSSRSYWSDYDEASDSSKERHCEPKHNRRKVARGREEERARSISAPLSDEEENFVQEIPEAALVAAQAYLLTTQPESGDPREHMHQAAIKSLGLVEDKLRQHSSEKKSTY